MEQERAQREAKIRQTFDKELMKLWLDKEAI